MALETRKFRYINSDDYEAWCQCLGCWHTFYVNACNETNLVLAKFDSPRHERLVPKCPNCGVNDGP